MGKQDAAERRGVEGRVSERSCRGRVASSPCADGICVYVLVIVRDVCLLPDQKSRETGRRREQC